MRSLRTAVAIAAGTAVILLFAAFSSDRLLMVGMGDSFSSGEANQPFYGGTCHRSHSAWPELVAQDLGANFVNVACSGATAHDMFYPFKADKRSQYMELLRLKPDIFTLTIGGNDVGFGSLLEDCFLPHRNRDCVPVLKAAVRRIQKVNSVGEGFELKLAVLFQELQRIDPKGRLVVVGYPSIFPPPGKPTVNCGWLSQAEQKALWKATTVLNSTLEGAVDGSYVHYGNPPLFVDVQDALAGHELCTADSWVYPVGRLPLYNDGHPKPEGQAAIAELVYRFIRAHR